jgi:hypothetical protein
VSVLVAGKETTRNGKKRCSQISHCTFLSNAVAEGMFLLRACIVNFHTSLEDIEVLPGIVIRIGREVDAALRPLELTSE